VKAIDLFLKEVKMRELNAVTNKAEPRESTSIKPERWKIKLRFSLAGSSTAQFFMMIIKSKNLLWKK
jgi:hypothetical protein